MTASILGPRYTIILSTVLIFLTICYVVYSLIFYFHSVSTTAVVVSIIPDSTPISNTKKYYYENFSFKMKNGVEANGYLKGRNITDKVGDIISIRYIPGDPNFARVFVWYAEAGVIILLLVICTFLIYNEVHLIRYN